MFIPRNIKQETKRYVCWTEILNILIIW